MVHWVMLHVKYQSSGPYGFREEEFLKFLLWKTDKPQGGAILNPGVKIWTKLVKLHTNLNKLGNGPLGDATY